MPVTASMAVAMLPLLDLLFDFADVAFLAVVLLLAGGIDLPAVFFVDFALDVADLLALATAFAPLLFFAFAVTVLDVEAFFDFDRAVLDFDAVVPDDELLFF